MACVAWHVGAPSPAATLGLFFDPTGLPFCLVGFGTFGVSLVSVGAIGSSVRAVSAPACEQAIIMVYRNANIVWEGNTGRSVFCGLVSGVQECLRDLE